MRKAALPLIRLGREMDQACCQGNRTFFSPQGHVGKGYSDPFFDGSWSYTCWLGEESALSGGWSCLPVNMVFNFTLSLEFNALGCTVP